MTLSIFNDSRGNDVSWVIFCEDGEIKIFHAQKPEFVEIVDVGEEVRYMEDGDFGESVNIYSLYNEAKEEMDKYFLKEMLK